ncbi:hypothetical protein L1887_43664 [Cichorium endivia]|nr:hypothetical protein L1887_43664 [Cichorium endivia]
MSFNEAFSEIDPKPIGVASLAQVHRAVDRQTGQQLALKMMHPDVERFSEVDMKTVTVLVKWVKRLLPDFSFEWLADEMNENMPLEMDFRHEAQNAKRAEDDFAAYRTTSVYIPKGQPGTLARLLPDALLARLFPRRPSRWQCSHPSRTARQSIALQL